MSTSPLMHPHDPRRASCTLPELSPVAERRMRLLSYADAAIHRAQQLYSRQHPFLVGQVKADLTAVRNAVSLYGEREVESQISNVVEAARTSLRSLGHAEPVMARDYYSGPIVAALEQIEAELKAPPPSSKAGKA